MDRLPGSGPAREALREKGQFWTPDWISEAMVGYSLLGGSTHILDPAVGAGAFFRAAKRMTPEMSLSKPITLFGREIDPDALAKARQNGLDDCDLENVDIRDFILDPPAKRFRAIVANPPYIRHHRLTIALKAKLKTLGSSIVGKPLDGRAGLHIYFLLRALQLLDRQGRLAFIMPADTCEGVFSSVLWNWITATYRLEAVITFSPAASPFPKVDTNPIIFLIRNVEPSSNFYWARCAKPEHDGLKKWVLSGFESKNLSGLVIRQRRLSEALRTGLSRPPTKNALSPASLGDFAKVLRGIATGSNEFFVMTTEEARRLRIPEEYLLRTIGRTRDVPEEVITTEMLNTLEANGRPTVLFSPDGRPLEAFPKPVRDYLQNGELIRELNSKPLMATRRPWYKMEVRISPPILFAYLGRRNARFIRNLAGVVPLTSFLCVYPRRDTNRFIEKLWKVLRHPETIANLPLVGKSYGDGAIKVEPRALERLPIPQHLLKEVGLEPSQLK